MHKQQCLSMKMVPIVSKLDYLWSGRDAYNEKRTNSPREKSVRNQMNLIH